MKRDFSAEEANTIKQRNARKFIFLRNALADRTLRPSATKVVLATLVLDGYMAKTDSCSLSIPELVKRTGLSQGSVERALRNLKSAKWIEASRHFNQPNSYKLAWDKIVSESTNTLQNEGNRDTPQNEGDDDPYSEGDTDFQSGGIRDPQSEGDDTPQTRGTNQCTMSTNEVPREEIDSSLEFSSRESKPSTIRFDCMSDDELRALDDELKERGCRADISSEEAVEIFETRNAIRNLLNGRVKRAIERRNALINSAHTELALARQQEVWDKTFKTN
jgi:hypothetical protein